MVPAGEKGIFGGPYIFFHSGISNRETDKRMYGETLSEKPPKNSKCPPLYTLRVNIAKSYI